MSHTPNRISRRGVIGLAAGGAFTAALAACGSDSSSSKSSTSGTAASGAAAGGKFPQTVPSIYGNVTVKEQPKRVVAVFPGLADWAVAMGVQPVAIAADPKNLDTGLEGRFTGTLDNGLWADGKMSWEKLGSYRPDIVLGNKWTIDKSAYSTASKIATTYCGREVKNGSWRDEVKDLSLLLTGGAAKGAEVLKQVDDATAKAKVSLAGLQGRTYQWVNAGTDNIQFGGGDILQRLGMVPGDQQNGDSSTVFVSYENLTDLNADVLLVWPYPDDSGKKKMQSDPRFSSLPSSKNGAVVWVTYEQAMAINGTTFSSVNWVVEHFVPILAKTELNKKG